MYCVPHTLNTKPGQPKTTQKLGLHFTFIGLARTIYIRCIYGIFGREITKDTVIYGAYILLWPTLHFHKHHARSQSTKHTCSYLTMLVAIALSEYSGRYLLFSKRTHTSTAHEDHFLTRGSMFATAKTVELYLS
jgi:hypothetical protein